MLNTLVVLPFSKRINPQESFLGLSVADRIRKAARKAGFQEVLFLEDSGPVPSVPQSFAVLSPAVLLDSSGWNRLAEADPQVGEILVHSPSRGAAAVNAPDRAGVEKSLSSGAFALDTLKQILAARPLEIGEKNWAHLSVKEDFPAAERWLLRSLIKDTEGFMSRHFERKISLAATRLLVRTSITPNQMTIFSTAIGVVGALFFISFEKWYHVIGALLFWLHSVLDGCDGEIARLKFLESRWGGLLDFWGDNLVHSVVFIGIAWGWYRWAYNPFPEYLAFLAVGGTLLSAGLVYWSTMRPKKGSGPLFTSVVAESESNVGGVRKVADFLARRDFIYLVILLALFDEVRWFLILGGYGAPIYAIILIALQMKEKLKRWLHPKEIS
jgi:phosphatidylglycerophosphate synthase